MAAAAIPLVLGAGSLIAGLIGSGKKSQIDPQRVPPIFPYGQDSFGSWLFQGLGYNPETKQWEMSPFPNYPGSSVASPDTTRLADVQGQWQPGGGPGLSWLNDYFSNNGGGIGQYSPLGQQLMDWGATQNGQGGQAMTRMKDWGSPSEDVGNLLRSMAISGFTTPDTGMGLSHFSQGAPDLSAKFLAPFLTGSINSQANIPPPSYRAPDIQARQIQRSA